MNENKKPKQPTHTIFQVIGEDKQARWIRVGAAWENRDGKGLNLAFDAYPVVGRIVIRENPQDDAEQAGEQASDRAGAQ